MTALGVILLLVGVAVAYDGPVDKGYLEDWCIWLFFVIVGAIGLIMIVRGLST